MLSGKTARAVLAGDNVINIAWGSVGWGPGLWNFRQHAPETAQHAPVCGAQITNGLDSRCTVSAAPSEILMQPTLCLGMLPSRKICWPLATKENFMDSIAMFRVTQNTSFRKFQHRHLSVESRRRQLRNATTSTQNVANLPWLLPQHPVILRVVL